MEYAIEAIELRKLYGDVIALDRVTFHIKKGEIFGLLGPNGAGKTTTIKIFTGLTKPTSGQAIVAGFDVVKNAREVKKRVGWIASEVIVDDELTGWENLEIQAKLTGVKNWKERAQDLLKYFNLWEAANRPVGKYSTGMRKRLEVAMALLHSPEVLFMDEPTIGLDVGARVGLWEVVERINKDFGVTVLLTTHYMEEAERLCHRIAIINKGRIIAIGTPDELKTKYGTDIIELEVKDKVDTSVLSKFGEVILEDGKVIIKTKNAEEIIPEVVKAIGSVKSVKLKKTSLDTVFMNLTGASIEGEQVNIQRLYRRIRLARR
ncbi:MAG: ABC transporter ATP-binding protein [Candidatus Nanoclepta minutus]|uniref:ABC transporter ATP-binding protein n=1 Tax=Candidatus Nanoclepta minutus TaxID=1940235 RepID=A0A397WQN6_9ARCH|nr:MAG: ABC transporter ATP-binding protein [Candidatus Nanoclepta minutus]